MVTSEEATTEARTPLSRERILRAAIALADRKGIDAVSMRGLGQALGVEAMSLYNHVSNKEDLLNGVVDLMVSEIEQTPTDPDWKTTLRNQALAARAVLIQHQWAPRVIESRPDVSPAMMEYYDRVIGILLDGGLSPDLTHHGLHVLGSRILGFTQELYDESGSIDENPEIAALMIQQLMAQYPNMSKMAAVIDHGDDILGDGCDSDFEFVFALDLILEGLERLSEAEQRAASEA
ncbi:MAG: TetR/AcrR family transcriptional regulator C-terminal domain-containing protein [Chloroflexi bacterium]|nr:TetR/AcrR family transcriptional regulator C-terminal domain-containing protein [Chloroflexota bacterium]MDA1145395.1 TetR/AcrR family transcriptional regulator C-terminal domain-containing protein [Chloroflexota bacterium]